MSPRCHVERQRLTADQTVGTFTSSLPSQSGGAAEHWHRSVPRDESTAISTGLVWEFSAPPFLYGRCLTRSMQDRGELPRPVQ